MGLHYRARLQGTAYGAVLWGRAMGQDYEGSTIGQGYGAGLWGCTMSWAMGLQICGVEIPQAAMGPCNGAGRPWAGPWGAVGRAMGRGALGAPHPRPTLSPLP